MTAAAAKEHPPCPFNRQEANIVQMAANGKMAIQIASKLDVQLDEVSGSITKAMRKVEAETLAHLVAIALRHGWVD